MKTFDNVGGSLDLDSDGVTVYLPCDGIFRHDLEIATTRELGGEVGSLVEHFLLLGEIEPASSNILLPVESTFARIVFLFLWVCVLMLFHQRWTSGLGL